MTVNGCHSVNLSRHTWLLLALLATPVSAEPVTCPPGATLSGAPPPEGNVVACQIRDARGRWVLHGMRIDWSKPGRKFMQGEYRHGKMHGHWIFWTRQGKKIAEVDFTDGLPSGAEPPDCPTGTEVQTHPVWPGGENPVDASLWFQLACTETQADKPIRHGPYLEYYPNRKKRGYGHYRHGVEHKAVTLWHPNGEPAMAGYYQKGIKTGNWTWWNDTGLKRLEGVYHQDRRHGVWKSYYDSGQIQNEIYYLNDKKEGWAIDFAEDGGKREEAEYQDDERHGKTTTFYPNGEISRIDLFANGLFMRSLFRQTSTGRQIPVTERECVQEKGRWGIFGLYTIPECDLPTADDGKACTDSDQCESVCVIDSKRPKRKAKGRCYDRFITRGTCLNYVVNGQAKGTVCVD